jgi:hypothetical protein
MGIVYANLKNMSLTEEIISGILIDLDIDRYHSETIPFRRYDVNIDSMYWDGM